MRPCSRYAPGMARRRRTLLVGLLAGGIVPLVTPGSASATAQDPETELANRYAPVARLVDQEEPCGPGEPYIPTDVDTILDQDTVALRGPWTENDLVSIAPSAMEIGAGLYEYHLDFPGYALEPGCSYEQWADRVTAGSDPTVYAHVATEDDQLALQYWFFYPFNDYNNKHEGDWESIQLNFDASTAAEALEQDPVEIGYSQHEGGERADWGDDKLEIVDGTHPVVHVAAGSHANYFDEGLFLGRSSEQGVGCDDARGPTHDVEPVVQTIPSDPDAALEQYPWVGFEGRWGERQEAFYNGPTGPSQKGMWKRPISVSEERWRDAAYAVPAGGLFGTTATGFFCGAVETGSDALRALVTEPARVLVALGIIIGLLAYAIARTTWRPTAPLRLAHRRAWGQVYAASGRMYLAHPILFLGIGLVSIPVSVIVAALHSGAFRAGAIAGVDPSGESGGFRASFGVALGAVLTFVGIALVHAATARAVTEIDAGREIGIVRAFRLAVERPRQLFGAVAVAAVVVGALSVSLLLMPLALYLALRWALIVPVATLEPSSAIETLRRSGSLVMRQPLKIAWLVVVTVFIAVATGPVVGTLLILASDAPLEIIDIVAGVMYAFLIPYTGLMTTYAYYDTRVRERIADRTVKSAELPAEA
jgi:Vacuolar protein sorting-associated protein 62